MPREDRNEFQITEHININKTTQGSQVGSGNIPGDLLRMGHEN